MVEAERAQAGREGVLLVDAGNALFPNTSARPSEAQRARARLLLQTMGQLGYAAMAVGARDVGGGLDFLRTEAARARVPLLSANLVGADGKRLFAASTVVQAAGLQVGLVGLSPEGPLAGAPGVKGQPAVAAALAEARRLRGRVDVVVVLAALPYPLSLQLLGEGAGQVDFILQSHDGRGVVPPQQAQGSWLLSSGDRGREVGRLALQVAGKGAFRDLGQAERARQSLTQLRERMAAMRQQLARRKDAQSQASLAQLQKGFALREAELEAEAKAGARPGARSFALSWLTLGERVASDAALQKQVGALEAAGGPSH